MITFNVSKEVKITYDGFSMYKVYDGHKLVGYADTKDVALEYARHYVKPEEQDNED